MTVINVYNALESHIKTAFPGYAFLRSFSDNNTGLHNLANLPRVELVFDRSLVIGDFENPHRSKVRNKYKLRVWELINKKEDDLTRIERYSAHVDAVNGMWAYPYLGIDSIAAYNATGNPLEADKNISVLGTEFLIDVDYYICIGA